MLGRPDSRSFTRLLVSLGAALVIAAFVVPGWVLRDTGTLKVTQLELTRLTPDARQAIIHRQHVAIDAGEWAPWAIPITLALGVGLIVVGALRLLPQEKVERELASAEKDIAKRRLIEQSPSDVDRHMRQEVAEDLADAAGPATNEPQQAVESIRRAAADRYLRSSRIEADTLQRLKVLAQAHGADLREHLYFYPQNGTRLGIDALWTSARGDDRRQITIEIKFPVRAANTDFTDALGQLATLRNAFELTFGTTADGWLIVVADTIAPRDIAVAMATADLHDRIYVSVIHPSEIAGLGLPEEIAVAYPRKLD